MEIVLVKTAWVREKGHPVGHPAPGKLQCRCGNAPTTNFNSDQGDVVCGCGIIYTWDGYIVSTPEKKV